MKRRMLVLGLLAGLSCALAAPPVVVEQKGDLFLKQSSSAPKRLTNYGQNYSPAVSPDGKWVAYLSVPEDFKPQGGPERAPSNVWLMDLNTFKARQLTNQKNLDCPACRDGFVRDALQWTADSRTLFWQEDIIRPLDHTLTFLGRFDVQKGKVAKIDLVRASDDSGGFIPFVPGPGGMLANAGWVRPGAMGVVVVHPDGSSRVFAVPEGAVFLDADLEAVRWLGPQAVRVVMQVRVGGQVRNVPYRVDLRTGVWEVIK